MRTTLLAAALLAAVSLAGLGAAHHVVSASQEAVTLTEKTQAGDPAAALGAQLDLSTRLLDWLQWDTRLTVGQEPETVCTLWPEPPSPQRRGAYWVSLDLLAGISSSNFPNTNLQLGWLRQVLDQLPLPTPDQLKVSATVPVSRYLDFYDLDTALSLPDSTLREYDAAGDSVPTAPAARFLYDLEQAFRFPVRPEHQVQVTLELEEDGGLHFSAWNVEGTEVQIGTHSARSPGWLYFIPQARTPDGTLWDYSGTPQGWGIYRLPDHGPYNIRQLEFVAPLEETQKVLHFSALEDGSALVLLTQEENGLVLQLLDPATGQERQAVPLSGQSESGWPQQQLYGDLMFLRRSPDAFSVLVRDRDGQWKLCLEDRLPPQPEDPQASRLGVPAGAAWDGQRLLLADRSSTDCSCSLFVYDATGLVYWGDYTTSLDAGSLGSLRDPALLAVQAGWS